MRAAVAKLRGAWPQLSALILMLVIDWLIFPSFFQLRLVDGRLTGSLVDVLVRGAPVALLALGMAGVIATRGIDLSVGAIMAIAGAVAATSIAGGSPWYVAVLLALLAGMACGIWNGTLVAIFGVQPIIATLVLMVAGRGIAQLITSGQITTFVDPQFAAIASGSTVGIPVPILIAVATAAILGILTRSTALGLMIRAIGINPGAADLVGIHRQGITFAVYVTSGITAALAGLIVAADIRGADANNAGLWLELDAILVVVLAGASLVFGGGIAGDAPWRAAALHAFGLGFIAFFVFGLGEHLLPRFTGAPIRGGAIAWTELACAHGGTLLLAAGFLAQSRAMALTGGVVALAAFAIFAWRLVPVLGARRATEA